MDGTLRCSAVVLLLLCALPGRADAQQFVCWPIAPGDTASGLARRLMGSADAAYGNTFQIRDPARRMFVPKSHYQRLQLDWQACLALGPLPRTPVVSAPVVELVERASVPKAIASVPLALDSALASLPRVDRPLSNPFAATFAVLLTVVISLVAGSLALRPIPPSVQRAGENFVNAFAWPLIDASSGVRPIETRLRYVRRKQELEISIAPTPGHRYPNLQDHKNNVEYDVDRVMRLLENYALSKPPRAAGRWVVVTIRPADEGQA